MRCPECQHPNVPGSLFCEICGADLDSQVAVAVPTPPDPAAAVDAVEPSESPAVTEPDPAAAPGSASAPESAAAQVSGVVCPHCGHANDPRFAVCEACGRPLVKLAASMADDTPARRLETDSATPPPPTPPAPTPGLVSGQLATGPQRGKVKLVVEQGMVLGKQFLLSEEQSLVGREDAGDRIYPEIDLSGLDEGYVHRRHALLTFEGTFLFVTHLGGHNRTYVNNRPIADQLPHPLNVGDTVRFGKVLLRVTEA